MSWPNDNLKSYLKLLAAVLQRHKAAHPSKTYMYTTTSL